MKNQFILGIILFCASGCSVFRPGTTTTENNTAPGYQTGHSGKTSQPRFLSGISTTDENLKGPEQPAVPERVSRRSSSKVEDREKFNDLQFKYAILTNTPIELLTNQRLLDFMDEWYGVPYHYGGNGKEGIDCSAFASLLIANVYQVNDLPRMSRDQYKESQRISKSRLREGDLVFFHTLGKGHAVTHVGVYLYNNRFIHASVAGVQISDLSVGYYASHYVGAGRVIPDVENN
jgi:lipoprotein Spr